MNRILIISRPKSGTYLCSEILKNLEITQSYMHLAEDAYDQYDQNKIEEGKRHPEQFRIKEPLAVSIEKVPLGSFAATHADCTEKNVILFKNFKKIVLMRDMEEILESFNLWLKESGRKKSLNKSFQNKIKNLIDWCEQENVFVLNFNEMINQDINAIDNLQKFLFGEIKHNSKEVLKKSLAADTLTKSSLRKKK